MTEIIREAPLGQTIRWLSRNTLLKYPEERPEFELPLQYITLLNAEKAIDPHVLWDSLRRKSSVPSNPPSTNGPLPRTESDLESLGMTRTKSRVYTAPYSNERVEAEQQLALERTKTTPIIPITTSEGIILVDWYTTDDAANPQNWSSRKRGFITFLICAYTWVVYTGSSIYAPSEGGVMESFGVDPTLASLPLSLYVLAYGVGPLLWVRILLVILPVVT